MSRATGVQMVIVPLPLNGCGCPVVIASGVGVELVGVVRQIQGQSRACAGGAQVGIVVEVFRQQVPSGALPYAVVVRCPLPRCNPDRPSERPLRNCGRVPRRLLHQRRVVGEAHHRRGRHCWRIDLLANTVVHPTSPCHQAWPAPHPCVHIRQSAPLCVVANRHRPVGRPQDFAGRRPRSRCNTGSRSEPPGQRAKMNGARDSGPCRSTRPTEPSFQKLKC